MATPIADSPTTPDGRYLVVRGRLWRKSNSALPPDTRQALVEELMAGRRAVQSALRRDDPVALRAARARVDAAKIALGERGWVWWTDGTPDLNRRLARSTGYADWSEQLATSAAPVDTSWLKRARRRALTC